MRDVYQQICQSDNLRRAWLRVLESSGCAGIDAVSVNRFADNLDFEIDRLGRQLADGTYLPLPLLRFFVPKSAGEAPRGLNIPTVRDRVAQHATINFIETLLESEFETCSFGYRRGRSVKQALEYVEFLRDTGFEWVVEADITSFFDNVNHEILFNR